LCRSFLIVGRIDVLMAQLWAAGLPDGPINGSGQTIRWFNALRISEKLTGVERSRALGASTSGDLQIYSTFPGVITPSLNAAWRGGFWAKSVLRATQTHISLALVVDLVVGMPGLDWSGQTKAAGKRSSRVGTSLLPRNSGARQDRADRGNHFPKGGNFTNTIKSRGWESSD
jgi:hypothetical protein